MLSFKEVNAQHCIDSAHIHKHAEKDNKQLLPIIKYKIRFYYLLQMKNYEVHKRVIWKEVKKILCMFSETQGVNFKLSQAVTFNTRTAFRIWDKFQSLFPNCRLN